MSQPAIIDLRPIYKNCDWSIILKFPYVITELTFSGKIIVDGINDVVMSALIVDNYRVKMSVTSEQVAGLEYTNYQYTIQQVTGKKPIAKGKIPIAEFEV